jgi:hypothetical protein
VRLTSKISEFPQNFLRTSVARVCYSAEQLQEARKRTKEEAVLRALKSLPRERIVHHYWSKFLRLGRKVKGVKRYSYLS